MVNPVAFASIRVHIEAVETNLQRLKVEDEDNIFVIKLILKQL